MTAAHIPKLLGIASAALTDAPIPCVGLPANASALASELLADRNGFVAFESALLVLPLVDPSTSTNDLLGWNAPGVWREVYAPQLLRTDLCFAEDIFGAQWLLRDGRVMTLDPELAEVRPFSDTLDEWAGRLLGDFRHLTGYDFAHEWQLKHGPLPLGCRLAPILPFVLGGEYTLSNFHLLDRVQAMNLRGDISRQLYDLPDGTAVRFVVED